MAFGFPTSSRSSIYQIWYEEALTHTIIRECTYPLQLANFSDDILTGSQLDAFLNSFTGEVNYVDSCTLSHSLSMIFQPYVSSMLGSNHTRPFCKFDPVLQFSSSSQCQPPNYANFCPFTRESCHHWRHPYFSFHNTVFAVRRSCYSLGLVLVFSLVLRHWSCAPIWSLDLALRERDSDLHSKKKVTSKLL